MDSNSIPIETRLQRHFAQVENIILKRQDPITGLLPASTAVNAHGDYTDAWVRDNVYSILYVWGLALAYRRFDPQHSRTYLLSHSTIKLMRGLLNSMMRQSDKVERFKHTLAPVDSLHAKYGTKSGLSVVGDDQWGHLQIDATSIFLLMCAQITASGLSLVYTRDEVDFIQNLVHYISRAYRTPDYGIWERGNKINHGHTEINCSSVGMAKAALEAMDGLNLFGDTQGNEGTIHVSLNDISSCRFTLGGLLPRESDSKETDAALLSIIGYPAYAVDDPEIQKRTKEKILKKLVGNYGCKRFLLDGHQSVIEDTSRLHYEPYELRQFEHIESEWPLFFVYLYLDALMRNDREESRMWKEKIDPLLVDADGLKLLPELYYVPLDRIEEEKLHPNTQLRLPNENVPLVWAQSLYGLCEMIEEGVLVPDEIDPLGRRHLSTEASLRRVAIPVIAENAHVKSLLAEYGYRFESIEELKPLKILHASKLSEIHAVFGQNEKLALTGRTATVMRTINTARVHRIGEQDILFLPYYVNQKGFYFGYDNRLLAEHFRASIKFLSKEWKYDGHPLLCFMIREDMFRSSQRDMILDLLHEIAGGKVDGIEVISASSVAEVLTGAQREYIDGAVLRHVDIEDAVFTLQEQCVRNEENRTCTFMSSQEMFELESMSDDRLGQLLIDDSDIHSKCAALGVLWERMGAYGTIRMDDHSITLHSIASNLYESAAICHEWSAVRVLAEYLNLIDYRLEDGVLEIVTRQKRLAVGRGYTERACIVAPLENAEIIAMIHEFSGNNRAEKMLIQEIILHVGYIIRTDAHLFSEMMTIRTWYLIQLMVSQISREERCSLGSAYEVLLSLAPHELYDRLYRTLKTYKREVEFLQLQENLHTLTNSLKIKPGEWENDIEPSTVPDWAQWRQKIGMLGHTSGPFHKQVWYMLQQCKGIIIGDKYSNQCRIGSELTLESTAGERAFALRIDSLIQSISAPDYRQLNIEAIESMSRLFRENPQLRIEDDLVMDVLIGHAVRIAWQQDNHDNYDESKSLAWESFYKLSPKEVDMAFAEAFIFLISYEEYM